MDKGGGFEDASSKAGCRSFLQEKQYQNPQRRLVQVGRTGLPG
jgi:hypothetical protein